MSCKEYINKLAEIIGAFECPSGSALSFSGGLDSSILAYLFRPCNPELYVVGFKGSRDVQNAFEIASFLGMRANYIFLSEEHIIEGISELKDIEEMSAVEISFELPLLIVAKNSTEKIIYTGQGADELFGGYAKYLNREELMGEDVKNLLEKTLPRERKIVSKYGKELVTPYLSQELIELSSNIPASCKINKGVRKFVLREAARRLGIPDLIVEREKKAAQYGSGIWKAMKKIAKRKGMSVEDFVRGI